VGAQFRRATATSFRAPGFIAVNTELIPTNRSGPLASLGQPESYLVALFVLSPALWLLVFATCYLSVASYPVKSMVSRVMRFCGAPHLATLFADGSPTSWPTLSR
jgi:hypothetical protein